MPLVQVCRAVEAHLRTGLQNKRSLFTCRKENIHSKNVRRLVGFRFKAATAYILSEASMSFFKLTRTAIGDLDLVLSYQVSKRFHELYHWLVF